MSARVVEGLSFLESRRIGRSGGKRSLLRAGLLAVLCFVGVALVQVWLGLQAVRLGYLLSTTAKLSRELEQENRELRLELATLTSPERLEEMARARLGLGEPGKGQVVILP